MCKFLDMFTSGQVLEVNDGSETLNVVEVTRYMLNLLGLNKLYRLTNFGVGVEERIIRVYRHFVCLLDEQCQQFLVLCHDKRTT